jgi:NAD(P)H-dependent FMN reductase
MHFFILAGSHREQAQSTKVATYVQAQLERMYDEVSTHLYDLSQDPLPLWNDGMWDKESEFYAQTAQVRSPVAEELAKADAIIVISPEWSGMATPGVKNFFLYANAKLMGNKPGLLMSVSSGRGGRYPISELRMSSAKNTQLCYIPQHVIIDHVETVLGDHQVEAEEKADTYIRKRIIYSLRMLHAYAEALQGVRASNILDLENYAFGM